MRYNDNIMLIRSCLRLNKFYFKFINFIYKKYNKKKFSIICICELKKKYYNVILFYKCIFNLKKKIEWMFCAKGVVNSSVFLVLVFFLYKINLEFSIFRYKIYKFLDIIHYVFYFLYTYIYIYFIWYEIHVYIIYICV